MARGEGASGGSAAWPGHWVSAVYLIGGTRAPSSPRGPSAPGRRVDGNGPGRRRGLRSAGLAGTIAGGGRAAPEPGAVKQALGRLGRQALATVTVLPALLAAAWLVPGAGFLLAGRLRPAPMVIAAAALA